MGERAKAGHRLAKAARGILRSEAQTKKEKFEHSMGLAKKGGVQPTPQSVWTLGKLNRTIKAADLDRHTMLDEVAMAISDMAYTRKQTYGKGQEKRWPHYSVQYGDEIARHVSPGKIPEPMPDYSNPDGTINPDAPYIIWDRVDKAVVGVSTYKNRKRTKTRADKLDEAYGGYRYTAEIWDGSRDLSGSLPRYSVQANDQAYMKVAEAGDTKKAQKLVDKAAKAAGYLIGPVYHGSPNKGFRSFKKGSPREHDFSVSTGEATHFTTNPATAWGYSWVEGVDGQVKEGEVREFYLRGKVRPSTETEVGVINALDKEGYVSEGFGMLSDSFEGETEYAVFDSKNIKLTNPITKDEAGNIIPLSERFQTESEDIRYSVQPEEEPPTEFISNIPGSSGICIAG